MNIKQKCNFYIPEQVLATYKREFKSEEEQKEEEEVQIKEEEEAES